MMVSENNDPRKAGTIWTLSLNDPVPEVSSDVPAKFQCAGPECLPPLLRSMGYENKGEILKRFNAGRRCYAVWIGDEIVSYGWVSFNEEFIGELRLRIQLLPNEAYIWDCATLPDYRGHHFYSALLGFMANELKSDPVQRIWIGADKDNLASQCGMARAGFLHVADLTLARVLAMRLAWVEGRPGISDDLVTEARRVFLADRDKIWLTAITRF